MSSVKPTISTVVPTPPSSYPKHSFTVDAPPKQAPAAYEPRYEARQRSQAAAVTQAATEHHHAASPTATTALSAEALSSTDVSYVGSLLGDLPAQKMEEILLKTGVPIPANLGPNIDTGA